MMNQLNASGSIPEPLKPEQLAPAPAVVVIGVPR